MNRKVFISVART